MDQSVINAAADKVTLMENSTAGLFLSLLLYRGQPSLRVVASIVMAGLASSYFFSELLAKYTPFDVKMASFVLGVTGMYLMSAAISLLSWMGANPAEIFARLPFLGGGHVEAHESSDHRRKRESRRGKK